MSDDFDKWNTWNKGKKGKDDDYDKWNTWQKGNDPNKHKEYRDGGDWRWGGKWNHDKWNKK